MTMQALRRGISGPQWDNIDKEFYTGPISSEKNLYLNPNDDSRHDKSADVKPSHLRPQYWLWSHWVSQMFQNLLFLYANRGFEFNTESARDISWYFCRPFWMTSSGRTKVIPETTDSQGDLPSNI